MGDEKKRLIKKGIFTGLIIFVIAVILIAFVLPVTLTAKLRAALSSWIIPSESALVLKILFTNVTVSVIRPVEIIVAVLKQLLVYIAAGILLNWLVGKLRPSQ